MPRINCQNCGTEFHAAASVLRRGGGKFCSLDCKNAACRRGETRQCPACGKEFYLEPWAMRREWFVFCSKQCLDRSKIKGEIRECHHCGKDVHRRLADIRKSRSKLFFCNHSCRASWTNRLRAGEKHPNWKLDQDRTNNRLENLVWMCHNCHHLIHHFTAEMNDFMATLQTRSDGSPSPDSARAPR
jgi:hypothetical protein